MKNLHFILRPLLCLAILVLGSACNNNLKQAVKDKEATINAQKTKIAELENKNEQLANDVSRLKEDVSKADKRAGELEKQLYECCPSGGKPKSGNSDLVKYYLIQAQAETEKAGARFKQSDYVGINEHAAKALAAITALEALSGEGNSGLSRALGDAKEQAEGLVEASAKKQHNDRHDHHEHLEAAVKALEKLMK